MANAMAYGFTRLSHLFADRVTPNVFPQVFDAVRESAAEHNRELAALLSTIVTPTTEYKVRYMTPGGGTLQPLDIEGEGNPEPFRAKGHYDVAFPMQAAGTAWGTNIVTREKMTVEEAARYQLEVQNQDADWMARHALAAIFDNVAWSFTDPAHGAIQVEPLANGDTVTYVRVGGTASTDDHYLKQAAAIADATNPYPTIYTELAEHPANTGPFVAYIASDLVATTQALTNFVAVGDAAIQYGTSERTLATNLPLTLGDEVIGRVDKMWIVEWRRLPSTYMIAQAQGVGPFLRMREHEESGLKGLFPVQFNVDDNHKGVRYYRYAGFGVYDRTAAVVMRIGNSSYAIPSGYDAPLKA